MLAELAVETSISMPAAGRSRAGPAAAVVGAAEEATVEDPQEMLALQARLDAIRAA